MIILETIFGVGGIQFCESRTFWLDGPPLPSYYSIKSMASFVCIIYVPTKFYIPTLQTINIKLYDCAFSCSSVMQHARRKKIRSA